MKKWLLLLVALTTNSLQALTMASSLTPEEQQLLESSQPLNDIFSLMYGPNSRYYKKLSPKEVQEGMENACQALAHLDPHSSFLALDEVKSLSEKMSGQICGIGIILPGDKETEEEAIPVIEIVPEGPAEKAGVKSGDKIIQINDNIVKGMKIDEVTSNLKGDKGTKVSIKVLRPNQTEPINIEMIRDIIKDEMSLTFFIEQQNVYYLLLSIFSEKSAAHVKNLLELASKKKAEAVIIDLRNNTGGLFDAALEIAGLFLPKGSIVTTSKDRNNVVTESWKTTRKPISRPEGMPIFFIVNNYTASSSEILAGSLRIYAEKLSAKENLNVFIVGTETFGKGSIQEVIPLRGDCALKMTTSLYYLPYDTCVQGKGITPDFLIESYSPPSETAKWMQSQFGRESALKKHIKPHGHAKEAKKDEKPAEKEKSWKEKRKDIIAQDYLIQNVMNLIDLLKVGKKAFPKMINFKDQLSFLKTHYLTGQKLTLTEIKS